jgi:hypothetical protein
MSSGAPASSAKAREDRSPASRASYRCGAPGYDAAVTSDTATPLRMNFVMSGIMGESTASVPPSL